MTTASILVFPTAATPRSWAADEAVLLGWTQSPSGWWWREASETELEDGSADFYFLGSGPFMYASTAEDALAMDAESTQWE